MAAVCPLAYPAGWTILSEDDLEEAVEVFENVQVFFDTAMFLHSSVCSPHCQEVSGSYFRGLDCIFQVLTMCSSLLPLFFSFRLALSSFPSFTSQYSAPLFSLSLFPSFPWLFPSPSLLCVDLPLSPFSLSLYFPPSLLSPMWKLPEQQAVKD